MTIFITLVLAYLLGSLPYGLVLVKIFKNVDIRTMGSNNIGFTNVFRVGYKKIAFITLFFDITKGALAVALAVLLTNNPNIAALAGALATLGHVFPVWLKFKGGKGVASGFGAVVALNPIIGLVALAVWLLTFFISKFSSLSAIFACVTILGFGLLNITSNSVYMSVALVGIPALILFKHYANIMRLINKTETKLIK